MITKGMSAVYTNILFASVWQFCALLSLLTPQRPFFMPAGRSRVGRICMKPQDSSCLRARRHSRVHVLPLHALEVWLSTTRDHGFSTLAYLAVHFVTRIVSYFSDGTQGLQASYSDCGFSIIAIITSLIVASVILIAVVANGFRKYSSEMPMVATCSAAISAACD